MTDTTIGAEWIAELRHQAEGEAKHGWVGIDPAFVIQLCDLASRALPAAPAAGDEKPQSFAVMTASGQTVPVEAYTAKQVASIREQARRDAIAECIAARDACIKSIEALTEAKS